MTTLERARELLTQMSASEKAQLLQWVVVDLSGAVPGVESRDGVCGGDPCIAGNTHSGVALGAGETPWLDGGGVARDLPHAARARLGGRLGLRAGVS